MEFEEFKTEYNNLLKKMLSYPLNQAGSKVYADKLADLCEPHPKWEEVMEGEYDYKKTDR